MKVLLTGGRGMLGRTLSAELHDFDVIPTDLPEVDITNPASLEKALLQYRPDAVIHCAAMTAVDKCESESALAYKINEYGTANVAKACAAKNIRLIAISTDYVFDGDSGTPYSELDKATGGRTVYGKSKFAGEEAVRQYCPDHIIARISWLYGAGGPSFVHTMLKLADGTRPELKVVADQIGNPTSALAVARKLRELLNRPELTGTFHLTCEGACSWAEFAVEIFKLAGRQQKVVFCTTEEFPRPAPRPQNSQLKKLMLQQHGLPPMPDWHNALKEFMQSEFSGGNQICSE